MKRILFAGLIFIFLLGLQVTHVHRLAHAEEGKAIDRVCTMQVDKDSAETLTKDGYTYYFCSGHCKASFEKNPEKYACICPQLSEGCECGHCSGKGGVSCECAEAQAESHTEGHHH